MMDEKRESSTASTDLAPAERAKVGPNANPFTRVRPFIIFRRLFTETLGTFMLVSVDCGGAIIARMSHGEITPFARSFATGLVIMALISTMGDVSGAHFNPAMTFAFALRKAFPWRMVPPYLAAQLVGAFAGSAMLLATFGDIDHLGATLPAYGAGRAFAIELLLTTLLVIVGLGTATRHRVLGPTAALAVGGTVATCSLFSRPVSGASMNPARSLAPAILSHTTSELWIYLTAPFLGAVLGFAIMSIVHHKKHGEEQEAASGEAK